MNELLDTKNSIDSLKKKKIDNEEIYIAEMKQHIERLLNINLIRNERYMKYDEAVAEILPTFVRLFSGKFNINVRQSYDKDKYIACYIEIVKQNE